MKLAQFKNPSGDRRFEAADEAEGYVKYCGYVQMTEFVEVEFTKLPAEVTVPAEIAVIDAAEAELNAKYAKALADLADRRSKLLALTHETEAV